ncbi:MAG: Type 1 glutamine amidotransferase-like domain-containing protein [Clostridium sp.]|nr:Type 1 glutamine amidotransferase-like domain-containing protein [Clostridium sp.]
MTLFITSSPTIGWAGPLNPANGFIDQLRGSLRRPIHTAMVSSYPDDVAITDRMAWELRECFEEAGIGFDHFEVIDRRTASQAPRIVGESNFVILCGGHVPTENNFFNHIGLRQLLADYPGVIMGISAGSMNCASRVFAPPELEGEAVDPTYVEYYEGLGLTDINIMPHFQDLRSMRVDGFRLLRDLLVPHSYSHPIYCLNDGSYLKVTPERTILCGETYRLSRGILRKICADGERKLISPTGRLLQFSD